MVFLFYVSVVFFTFFDMYEGFLKNLMWFGSSTTYFNSVDTFKIVKYFFELMFLYQIPDKFIIFASLTR